MKRRHMEIFLAIMMIVLLILGVVVHSYVEIAGGLLLGAAAILALGVVEISLPRGESLIRTKKA